MRLSYRCGVRKQQVDFDDLPVAGGAEAHSMVVHSEVGANRVQLFANLLSSFGVGIIEQANCRAPCQASTRPQNIRGNGDRDQRVKWLPSRKHYQAQDRKSVV